MKRKAEAPHVILPDELAPRLQYREESLTLDVEAEEILQLAALDFVEQVTSFACQLAKHRDPDTRGLEENDLATHLEHGYGIRVLGHQSTTSGQVQKMIGTQLARDTSATAHRQRLSIKRKIEDEEAEAQEKKKKE